MAVPKDPRTKVLGIPYEDLAKCLLLCDAVHNKWLYGTITEATTLAQVREWTQFSIASFEAEKSAQTPRVWDRPLYDAVIAGETHCAELSLDDERRRFMWAKESVSVVFR
jgi:hypothetical protein